MKKSLILITLGILAVAVAVAVADESTPATTRPLAANPAVRFDEKLGVGVMIGEPTGGTVKLWLTDVLALDGAVGWSCHDDTDLYLHSDILWHKFDLVPVSRGQLAFYCGAGGLMRLRDNRHDNEFGVRVPIGVSYTFENSPVDVFIELAPAADLAPVVRADFTGGIGIRYWF